MGLFDFDRKRMVGQYKPSKSVSVRGRSPKEVLANCGPAGGAGGPFSGGFGSGGGGFSGNTSSGGGNYGVSRYSGTSQHIELGSIINEWMPKDPVGMHTLWRQMYLHDAVCGTAVDLISSLIWSDYDLLGIADEGHKEIFYSAMTNLQVDSLMVPLTAEYLTIGRISGSLLFDDEIGTWTGIMPHDPDFITLTPYPILGIDPKIDLRLSPGLSRLLKNSSDPRDRAALAKLPASLVNRMRSGNIELDPDTTLFVPRKTLLNDYIGTSIFTRAVPYFALESSLLSGTLIAARRRQRSILHLEIGIEDLWEPEPEEIDDIVGLFMQADEDPQGAIVGTKRGVQIQEVRDGANFWKISDEISFINESKMKALGINEQFLSGESNYSTMEVALSVFVEQIRHLRDHLTNRIFYRKVFPSLARVYGLRKINKSELEHRIKLQKTKEEMDEEVNAHIQRIEAFENEKNERLQKTYAAALKQYQNSTSFLETKDISKRLNKFISAEEAKKIPDSELLIPQIHWHKQLKPEADENYLNVLGIMEEKGIPVPLRTWSAAGGIDLDKLMDMMKEDIDLRLKIREWKTSAGDQDQAAFAKLVIARKKAIASTLPTFKNAKNFMGVTKEELTSYIETYDSRKYAILANPEEVENDLAKHFQGNTYKIEAMKFLLKRCGMVNFLLAPEVVEAAISSLKDSGMSLQKTMKEINVIEKYYKDNRNSREISADIKEAVKQANSTKSQISSNSPLLYKGL